MQFISRDAVSKLLTYDRAFDLMEHALVAAVEPAAIQPPRIMIGLGGDAILGIMAGAIDQPNLLGTKITAVFPPGRRGPNRPSHQGVIVLFDASTGEPRAIVDGTEITNRRTAAASAVATRRLARENARTILFVGTGEQARAHLEAFAVTMPFAEFLVWGRNPNSAKSLVDVWNATNRNTAIAAANLETAIGEADIVCTLTAAPDPIVYGAWVKPGTHLNVVGSSDPKFAEIDDELVARAQFFVDRQDAVQKLGGEFRRAIASGMVDENHIAANIGDVITGRHPGRQGQDDITIFKSVGLNAEDLLAADWVVRRTEEMGIEPHRGDQLDGL